MFLLTCATMYYLGIKKMLLVYAIRAAPNPLEFAIGHGGKCIIVCILFLIFSHIVQSLLRYVLYRLFCVVKGYEPLTLLDQFWLYDLPVNPMNVPSIMVIERPKAEQGTAEQILEATLKRIDDSPYGARCRYKMISAFGNWFLKR